MLSFSALTLLYILLPPDFFVNGDISPQHHFVGAGGEYPDPAGDGRGAGVGLGAGLGREGG